MSHPFKVGDKVVCCNVWHDDVEDMTTVRTVAEVHSGDSDSEQYLRLLELRQGLPAHKFAARRYRAAINGKDYPATCAPAPAPNDLYPSGHLADGSSVQKHSAGELYPYVVAYRDSTDPHSQRKYDVGLIGPRVVGTAWFTSFEDAVAAATALKE